MADEMKIVGDVKLATPRFACACPKCGDSVQTVNVTVPNHGTPRPLMLAWCMDCLEVVGYALPATGSNHG